MEEQKPHKIQFSSYLIIAGFIVVAVWGWYVLEQFTNLRITTLLGTAKEEPIPIFLPLAVSVLGPLIAVFLWKRALGIVQNGFSTSATVHSIGPEVQSMRNIEFTYVYDGSEYSKKMSVSSPLAEKLDPGGTLEIMVDKRKPTRVLIK